MGQRTKYHGEFPTSPARDKRFCNLADRMVSCSVEKGRVCERCTQFERCDEWFDKRCGKIKDTFLKQDALEKYLGEFEAIRACSG